MPRTALVCVNYDSSAHVSRLLDSLRGVDVAEIILWDNFSSEDERVRLAAIVEQHPNARLEFADDNLGFGPAVNRAIATVQAEVDQYWVLNPDITVEVDTLANLSRSAGEHDCAIISPLVLTGSGERIWYAGGDVVPPAGRTVHRMIGRERSAGALRGYSDVSFVTGAALLVKKDAWDTLGGFDERFFLYCEDADLSIRAERLGLRMGVESTAVARHFEGGSSGGTPDAKSATFYFYVQRNRLILYRQFVSRAQLLIGRGGVETLRLLVHPVLPISPGALGRLRASLSGVFAGIRGEVGPRSGRVTS